MLVTDLGEQNQRLGKQLAEAEEAALDLRAQVGINGDQMTGSMMYCVGGGWVKDLGYLRRGIYVCLAV